MVGVGLLIGGLRPLRLLLLVGLASLLVLEAEEGVPVKLLLEALRRGVGMLLLPPALPMFEVDPDRLIGVVVEGDFSDDRREDGVLLLTGVDLPLDLPDELAAASLSSSSPASWMDRFAAPSSHLFTWEAKRRLDSDS